MIDVLSIVNLLVCGVGVLICITKMGAMDGPRTKICIGLQNFLLGMVLLCSALSYLYDQPATPIQLAVGSVIVVNLIIGIPAWWHNQPGYALASKKPKAKGATLKGIERRIFVVR